MNHDLQRCVARLTHPAQCRRPEIPAGLRGLRALTLLLSPLASGNVLPLHVAAFARAHAGLTLLPGSRKGVSPRASPLRSTCGPCRRSSAVAARPPPGAARPGPGGSPAPHRRLVFPWASLSQTAPRTACAGESRHSLQPPKPRGSRPTAALPTAAPPVPPTWPALTIHGRTPQGLCPSPPAAGESTRPTYGSPLGTGCDAALERAPTAASLLLRPHPTRPWPRASLPLRQFMVPCSGPFCSAKTAGPSSQVGVSPGLARWVPRTGAVLPGEAKRRAPSWAVPSTTPRALGFGKTEKQAVPGMNQSFLKRVCVKGVRR